MKPSGRVPRTFGSMLLGTVDTSLVGRGHRPDDGYNGDGGCFCIGHYDISETISFSQGF